MKVQAAGQKRNHGWNEIVSCHLQLLSWTGPDEPATQTISWDDRELHLNGNYKVQVSFTRSDARTLAGRMLSKDDLIKLAKLSDADKIAMAKDAMAKLSDGEKPNIKVLFGMLEAMLPRAEMIALLKLTDDERISLVRETCKDMPFGQLIARLNNIAGSEAA